MKNNIIKLLRFLVAAAFWLTVWFLCAKAVGFQIILPSPFDTLKALAKIAATSEYAKACLGSFINIMTGLLTGTAAGVLLAILTSCSGIAYHLISPVLSVIRSTPVASFILLAYVWLGRSVVPSFASMIMIVPVIWAGVCHGIRSIDKDILEVADVFKLSPWKKFSRIYAPGALPSFINSFCTCLGLAWKAGIAAEVLCTPKDTIGTHLYQSKVYLESAELFAWTATIIVLSMIFEKTAAWLLGRLKKRIHPYFNASDRKGGRADDSI